MRAELWVEFSFEAAHWLPRVPAGHKCQRLHGHSYRLCVRVEGEVDPETGMVIDFAEIEDAVRPLLENELDHRCLNEIEGLANPTSEHLAGWLWQRIRPSLPSLSVIEVSETPLTRVLYRGD